MYSLVYSILVNMLIINGVELIIEKRLCSRFCVVKMKYIYMYIRYIDVVC